MLDFIIKNGHVIDPYSGVDEVKSVGVKGNYIVEITGDESAVNVIDADGYYVFPGFIDAHGHAFYQGSGLGVMPDIMVATGVTTVVDAGTAGWSNYRAFHNTTVCNSLVRVKALVAYNNSGQIELGYCENYDKKTIKIEKIRELLKEFNSEIIGIKLRFQREVTGDTGTKFLDELIEVAQELECQVTVHTTDPPAPADEIAKRLRPGDVYCHMYQGKGHTIIGDDGHVLRGVWEARERGVLFDAANGTGNFAFSAAIPAIKDGFYPDLIGADNASNSYGLDLYARNLPFVLSKYLMLGMTLQEVIKCVTQNAAKYIGMEGEVGTLKPGARADIAIMKVCDKKQIFWDSVKTSETQMTGDKIIVPRFTMIGGTVVFRDNTL